MSKRQIMADGPHTEPSKLSKLDFEGFDGSVIVIEFHSDGSDGTPRPTSPIIKEIARRVVGAATT